MSFVRAASRTRLKALQPGDLRLVLFSLGWFLLGGGWEGWGCLFSCGFSGRRMEMAMVNLRGLFEQLTRQAELLSEGNECRKFCP